MIRLLLSLPILLIVACNSGPKECQNIFLAGEIVNPTSSHVVLYRDDMVIDSAKLDQHHHFTFNLQGAEEGLYHFDHSPELQYIYLQEGDSILIRLNTLEFDESLVFSGEGSEINNFLIEMFLIQEDEEPLIGSYFHLQPKEFSHKIDSLHALKIEHLNEVMEENSFSDGVLAMAKASIDYGSYIYKEKYPFYHKKKTGEETIHVLEEDFYGYRNDIDLNNRELSYFRPYYDFVKYHLGNLSYMACMKKCETDQVAEIDRLHFNEHKLKLVDSLVKETQIRDMLFRNIAMDYLLGEHRSDKACETFVKKFEALSTNEAHKGEIKMLYNGILNLQPNSEVPDIHILNVENHPVALKEISKDKNTVFYFWTASQKRHMRKVLGHVANLEKKHPNHQFIGISLKTGHPQWLNILEEYSLDSSKQFRGENFKEVQTAMIVDGLNKCVIAKDTLIVDAFANLYKSF
ncbi:MAG: transaldolase [Bacteroidota bacterium]